MQKRSRVMATVLGVAVGLGVAGITHAANPITGQPNSHSQVGRQGTKNNQNNPLLTGKANKSLRSKKVTDVTRTPMPASWVAAGAKIFTAQCQTCHGPSGNGTTSAPRLSSPSPIWYTFHTESALQAYIQAHMPGNHPGTLTGTQAKDVAAYVWTIARTK